MPISNEERVSGGAPRCERRMIGSEKPECHRPSSLLLPALSTCRGLLMRPVVTCLPRTGEPRGQELAFSVHCRVPVPGWRWAGGGSAWALREGELWAEGELRRVRLSKGRGVV